MEEEFTPEKLKAIIEVLVQYDDGKFAYAVMRDRGDVEIEQIIQLENCIAKSVDGLLCINYANNNVKCTDVKRFISIALKLGISKEYIERYGEKGYMKPIISDNEWYNKIKEKPVQPTARIDFENTMENISWGNTPEEEVKIDKSIRPAKRTKKKSTVSQRKQRKKTKKSVAK